jgi:hypothetical protein
MATGRMIMANGAINTMMRNQLVSYERDAKSVRPILSVATLFLDADGAGETDKKQLRETLSRNGNLRKKDFERMMTAVAGPGNNRAKEIRLSLRDFLVSQQEMIGQLGGCFSQIRACVERGDIEKIKPVFARAREIIAQQEQARRELERDLATQEKKHQEILAGIKSLLQKGRELQVRDFKEMLAGMKCRSTNRMEQNGLRREAVSQMLAGYKEQRLQNEEQRQKTKIKGEEQ